MDLGQGMCEWGMGMRTGCGCGGVKALDGEIDWGRLENSEVFVLALEIMHVVT